MPKKLKRILESGTAAGRRPAGSRATRPPLLRMVRIHDLLSAGRHPNCSLVAREFEVSTKTIQRDVDFMRDQLLLPIDYDRVRHGFAYTQRWRSFRSYGERGELVASCYQKAVERYVGRPSRSRCIRLSEAGFQSGDEANVSLHELSEAVLSLCGSSSRSDQVFEAWRPP
jgi:proteasome accessory factor B